MNRWPWIMKFNMLTGLFVIIFLISPLTGSGQAQTYGIPKTGQDNIYHPSSGTDLGDDGVIQAGFPLGSRRILAFQDNNNGTITDLASGLMWQKADSLGMEFGDLSRQMSWTDAFSYVAAMNSQGYGGHYDWRIPNIKELSSIINQGTWLPSIYYIFDSMQSANYWSSTSLEIQGSQRAYHILFNEGFVQYAYPDSSAMYVKAVRSYLPGSGVAGFPKTGQTVVFHAGAGNDKGDDGETRSGFPMTGDSYTDNGNGTITQNATGMFWQQSDSATQSFGGYSGALTWEEGFAYVAQMNAQAFAGYTDWRMPNYFELISLLDFEYFWPIMGPLFDPEKYPYWSSTNRFGVTPPTYAWTVSWASGWGNVYEKTDTYYIRAVRGGPVITPSPIPLPSPTPNPRYGVPKTG
ncbi:MAG: DUF1566 domain-containing protein, partial [Candidatus Auribacterota bacterium]|nr:DUF1566 domain-containing protein [Candidatus Auribacterota bacterium]